MVMVDEAGEFDVVERVEWVGIDSPVYDLDVERTHNFVANGIVTHNSIYKFRGADFRNLLKFEDAFPTRRTVVLDQNYRSTQRILDAANAVIANNASHRPKHLWTDKGEGEPIVRFQGDDEHDEAAFVVREIHRLDRRRPTTATATSRSSTAPTRRAACSKSRWCGRACRTACSAA